MSPAVDRDPTDLGLPALPDPTRHECRNGWIDEDAAVPCLTCRPHLQLVTRPDGRTVWTAVRLEHPTDALTSTSTVASRRSVRAAGHGARRGEGESRSRRGGGGHPSRSTSRTPPGVSPGFISEPLLTTADREDPRP